MRLLALCLTCWLVVTSGAPGKKPRTPLVPNCLPPNSPAKTAAIQAQINSTPPTPDWKQFFKALPELPRRLRIGTPCVGIGGSSHAMHIMGPGADSVLVYDLDARYAYYLNKHLEGVGMRRGDIRIMLGRVMGDLLRLPPAHLSERVDILCAGPPCPPWAAQGSHSGLEDQRASVFVRLLVWIFVLAHSGGLLGVCLENVPGILSQCKVTGMSVMQMFIQVLQKHLPQFCWRVDKLELVNYLCPQSRVRVFLRGMRRLVCSCVPPPLPPFGRRPLREVLAAGVPPTPRSSLTPTQRVNLLVAGRNRIIVTLIVLKQIRAHNFNVSFKFSFGTFVENYTLYCSIGNTHNACKTCLAKCS